MIAGIIDGIPAARRVGFAAARYGERAIVGLRAALLEEIERRRLLPWGAVLFGVGILAFFSATDPRPGLAAGIALAAALAAAVPRTDWRARIVLCAVAFLAAGYAAAGYRQAGVAAPIFAEPAGGRVIGTIERLDDRGSAQRAVLRIETHDLPTTGEGPLRVRVTLRDAPGLAPGDRIDARVRLLPPPEAVRPGGYDFAKEAYFRGIGAVGSLIGRPVVLPAAEDPNRLLALAARLDGWRNALTARIADTVGGQAGAVTAALVTGKRGLIVETTNEVLRAAGVYHVVSISGLHMVLAAGTVYLGLRALLALVPALALGFAIERIAALAAIAAGAAYCLFSGSAVATERALVMTTIGFTAILLGRPALSMRNLAFAALIVLATAPEALVGPSFQMSFSAVAGLIAAAEWQSRRVRPPAPPPGRLGRLLRAPRNALVGILATTLVASLATGPFAAFHFQVANPYGLLGNLLALPIVTIVVMPACVLAVVLLPLGLDGIAWSVAGAGVAQVIAVSEFVAGLPGSRVVVPAFGTGALACLVAALLLATLCTTKLKRLAFAPALVGLALAAAPTRPDVYLDRDGRGLALRGPDGTLVVLGDPGDFVLEQWLAADGDARFPSDPSLRNGVSCDALACVAALHDAEGRFAGMVSHVRDPRAFATDCDRARIVVARFAAPAICAAEVVVGRGERAATGAATLRVTAGGFERRAVRREGETRPWLARTP